MRILVCGSRNWTDVAAIEAAISGVFPILVGKGSRWWDHGGCQGADTIAATYLASMGENVVWHAADWERHGRRAGPIRNREMLELEPILVVAFPLGPSPGTWDTIHEAARRGIPTHVYGKATT